MKQRGRRSKRRKEKEEGIPSKELIPIMSEEYVPVIHDHQYMSLALTADMPEHT